MIQSDVVINRGTLLNCLLKNSFKYLQRVVALSKVSLIVHILHRHLKYFYIVVDGLFCFLITNKTT